MALGNSILMRATWNALSGVYSIGFRWWLEPLLTRQSEHKLRAEIRGNCSFLFDNFGARFVPNEREYRWGKVVTLATPNLRLQVSKDRGEYGASVSPVAGKVEWAKVCDALKAVIPEWPRPVYDPISLTELSAILEPQFARLEEAYGPEKYPFTKRNLEQGKADAKTKMKAEVKDVLEKRTDRATLIHQVLIESDSHFSETQAWDISGLFDQFPGYRWNQQQESMLRTNLYTILQPFVGAVKMIEVANRLLRLQK